MIYARPTQDAVRIMAAGENFSLFGTDSNGLFACGSNVVGELATGDDQRPGTTFNYVKVRALMAGS